MKRFEFTEDLYTGLADIDEDHRQLLETTNIITSSSFAKEDDRIIEDTLTFLGDYILYHFAAEEFAMSNAGYPGIENHSGWHKKFQQDISGDLNDIRMSGPSKERILKISFAMENWFLEHIRNMDCAFARFLRESNSQHAPLAGVQSLKKAGRLPTNFNSRIAARRS
ncbi:MAG: hemerythrin family protein [Syntrophales bacterium]|nr:hemerythrin family protein [Syntrophales bacterium]